MTVDREHAAGRISWTPALTLDRNRERIAGSEEHLATAVRRGADLRIYTEFLYNEHIDPDSDNDEIVQEVSEFHVTYLLEDRWVAGIMTGRQPVEPPIGFGPRPSMSFFLYNQNGRQAIARPYLDGPPSAESADDVRPPRAPDMPKMRIQDDWDADTNAPSMNFIYDFERYRYFVRDDWREVLAHGADGAVGSGSLDALAQAHADGAEVKVAVRGLCGQLDRHPARAIEHEVFIQTGWTYYHPKSKLFVAALHPLVRVAPAVPLRYGSRNWDFGWLVVRTDGRVAHRMVDPRTLNFADHKSRYALRWFVRP